MMGAMRSEDGFWEHLRRTVEKAVDERLVIYLRESAMVVIYDPSDETHGVVLALDHIRVRNGAVLWSIAREQIAVVIFEPLLTEVDYGSEGPQDV